MKKCICKKPVECKNNGCLLVIYKHCANCNGDLENSTPTPVEDKMDLCPNCGGNTAIRNPTGHCDHLYYPENVPTPIQETEEKRFDENGDYLFVKDLKKLMMVDHNEIIKYTAGFRVLVGYIQTLLTQREAAVKDKIATDIEEILYNNLPDKAKQIDKYIDQLQGGGK